MTDARIEEISSLKYSTLKLARRLRKHSNTTLTPSQTSALWTLERHGAMRVGDLARREQIGKSSVTRLIAKLEALGHLTRVTDPDDRRSYEVALTRQGLDLLDEANEMATDYLAHQVAALTQAERGLLLAALPVFERLATARL
jgi:DNA-binding MarR family transcriptional regulator